MPDLAMSAGVRRRSPGSLRPSSLFNMFLEPDEQASDGFARQSRPGLTERSSVGVGPIAGMFSKRGVLSDALFAVSGSDLYKGSSLLGTIAGTGFPSWAGSASEVAITRGGLPYSYNGTDLAAIATPDGWSVNAVAYLGGYTFFARAGTHRIYWSTSGDARTIDALDFVSAESEPDALYDLYIVNDSLWALGSESVEVFQLTGDADAVIARVEGILLKKGVIQTGAAAEADNTLFWWGHDHFLYRAAQGAPQAVSDQWLAVIMARSALRGVFSFTHEGRVVVCVRTDEGTFALDVGNGKWSELGSYGRTGWRISDATHVAGVPVLGDEEDGTLWDLDPENYDDGGHLERRFSASFTLPGGTVIVARLGIIGNPGDTPLLAGQGSEPILEMRCSRDNGKTWGGWRSARLGVQGRYRQRIEKRRWGMFDSQGGIFEFRVTDPVPFRASRVFANEPGGGRGSRGAS